MLKGVNHRLDIAADAAELAECPLARAAVAWCGLQTAQGLAGAFEGRGDPFGISGHPRRRVSSRTESELSQQCTVSAMDSKQRA